MGVLRRFGNLPAGAGSIANLCRTAARGEEISDKNGYRFVQNNLGLFDIYLEGFVEAVIKGKLNSKKTEVRLFREQSKPIGAVNQSVLAVDVDSLSGVAQARPSPSIFRGKFLFPRQ